MKANLPWIDAVGGKVAEGLVKRYARPIIYRQSGPYIQKKHPHVGVYFNDPILHYVARMKSEHKADFRFGFFLERDDSRSLCVGFDVLSPTISARFLMPSIRAEHAEIASRLRRWLRRREDDDAWVRWNVGNGQKFVGDREFNQAELADALLAYANVGRKKVETWKRYRFSVSCLLPEHDGWSETKLIKQSDEVASSAMITFK